MTLGGLWHGAGFQFILWGALHGSLLVIENTLRRIFPAFIRKIPVAISWFVTFGLVMVLWIPFRAEDVEHAGRIFAGLQYWQLPPQVSLDSIWKPIVQLDTSLTQPWVVLFLSVLALALTHVMPTAWRWALAAGSFKRGCLVGFAFLMAVKTLVARPEQPFLYFQF
jgi:alginate O-acetyltransferase complex protein AlgI